jgi:hypothetical protein
MTAETGFHAHRCLSLMTRSASFAIGVVEKASHKSLTITSMGVVTREASFEGCRVVLMGRLQTVFVMAGQTEGIRFIFQELQVICLVRVMTAGTVAVCIRFVSLLIFFLESCVAF